MSMNSRQRTLRAELRRNIDVTRMGGPNSPEKLHLHERRLGQKLPLPLRQVYRACNGFSGPEYTGFLRSLGSLVRWNLTYRAEAPLPKWAVNVIWFGNDGGGGDWGIDPARPNRIIEW